MGVVTIDVIELLLLVSSFIVERNGLAAYAGTIIENQEDYLYPLLYSPVIHSNS